MPIIILILAILCVIIFIQVKKNKLIVTNTVLAKGIALTGIIVSLLLGISFIVMGIQTKNDGIDSDWYITIRKVRSVYESGGGYGGVKDFEVDTTPYWYMEIEGYDDKIKIDEDYYYRFKEYENLENKPKIYAVFSKNNKVLVWYDASKFNYVGDKLKE